MTAVFEVFFLEKRCISLSLSAGNVIENRWGFLLVINLDLDSYHMLMFLIILHYRSPYFHGLYL